MAWHYAHASLTVVTGETEAHGSRLREFWLVPETNDWVEVYVDAAVMEPGPRTPPYVLDRLLVTRGPVGELLGQEFSHAFEDHEALLELQEELDGLRAVEDETRWTPERRARIDDLQEALNDRVYGSAFSHRVLLTVFSDAVLPELERDLHALNLPRRKFVTAVVAEGRGAPRDAAPQA